MSHAIAAGGQSLPVRCHLTSSRPDCHRPPPRRSTGQRHKVHAQGLRPKSTIARMTDSEPDYRPAPSSESDPLAFMGLNEGHALCCFTHSRTHARAHTHTHTRTHTHTHTHSHTYTHTGGMDPQAYSNAPAYYQPRLSESDSDNANGDGQYQVASAAAHKRAN